MLLDYVKLKEVKPALSGYIRDARLMLKQDSIPDDKVIHDVRVLMKKSRAVMRLIGSQMDEESYKREYQSMREVGRIMRTWRETSVHRKILKSIRKKYPHIFIELKDFEKLNSLVQKQVQGPETREEIKSDLQAILEILNKSDYRIRFLSINNLDPRALLKELDKTYNLVADCYVTSRNNLKPASLHEFRKKTKDLLYQLYFFRPLKNQSVKTMEKQLDTIAQNLGKYNDLEVLVTALGYKRHNPDNSPAINELIVLIREEQDRYLSKVWPIAYKVFCPSQNLINVLGFKLLFV
jgi:CHAD domain-containing protein